MTYAELDRLFFENLRKTLVIQGFLPDVTQYQSKAEFDAARQALSDALDAQGLEIIDVFGVGAGDNRGRKTGSRITIGRGRQERGSVSIGPQPFKVREGETFTEYEHLDSNKNIRYEVRCICNSTREERILMAMVDLTLGQRRYAYTVGEDGLNTPEMVLIEWLTTVDVTATTDQRETLFQYVVVDAWVGAEKILRTGIAPLNSVDYFVYSQNENQLITTNNILKP